MQISRTAIAVFALFVALTLVITAWASRRAKTASQFYAAGGTITPWQNGLAIAGDYLSAASFLGSISVFFQLGVDGLIYAVGAAAGWPVATCLIAERLRKLGKFTFADVLCVRLNPRPIRAMAALMTLAVCGAYLTSQMVGAGTLVQILFNIPYTAAVILVGILMSVYVMCGGMVATTWIQIVKATILIITATAMGLLVLARSGFAPSALVDAAALTRSDPASFLSPGGLLGNRFDAIGLGLAFALGPAGMPHVLMRFFTVRNPENARRSLVNASLIIVVFQILVILLGVGAVALVSGQPDSLDSQGKLIGGANMAAIHLARQLGGTFLLGVVAAVTFATILAVVSGLTLAAAAAVSHDLYRNVFGAGTIKESEEVRVSRIATVVTGCVAIGVGLACRDLNIGFLATLPLVIAASCNLPILLLAMFWRGLTTAGALVGGYAGLVLSVSLVLLGPKVWTGVLGHTNIVLPFDYPTAISLGSALLLAWIVSIRCR